MTAVSGRVATAVFSAWLSIAAIGCSYPPLREPKPPYLAVRGRELFGNQGLAEVFAIHSYVTWNDGKENKIAEVEYGGKIVAGERSYWHDDHETYALVEGSDATEFIGRIDRFLKSYPHPGRFPENYTRWPGPNSNWFVADLCGHVGVSVDLPPTAIGKDWPDTIPHVFGIDVSPTGLGFQLDVFVFGVQVGLIEGVEVHLFGTSIGISLWPPALKLPIVGRIGFR